MNIAVGLSCLVAVAVLEGVTGQSERQLSNENQNGGNDGNNLTYIKEERPAGNQPRSKVCRLAFGGKCVNRNKLCPSDCPESTLPGRPYCNKQRQRCCYPATCAGSGGTQIGYAGVWYCLKRDFATWAETRNWCIGMGMTISQPSLPFGLATIIASVIHVLDLPCWYWLNGYGDGVNQVWADGPVISNTDPRWGPGQPNVGVDYCLELSICGNLSTPLTTWNCSRSGAFRLCQAPLENNRISKESIRDESYSDEWDIYDELDSDADVENDTIQEDKLRDTKKGNESDEDEANKDE